MIKQRSLLAFFKYISKVFHLLYYQKIINEGLTIVEDVDREAFKTKLAESDVVQKFEKEWVPHLLERIRELE